MDLLNNFKNTGKGNTAASSEGSDSSEPTIANDKGNIPNIEIRPDVNNTRGTNLLNNASKTTASTEVSTSVDTSQSSSKVEPTGTVTDPDSWTKETALLEAKKAREEAKNTRLKYQEQLATLKEQAEARVAAVKAEQEALLKKAEELDNLKAKEEDKKRDLSEKLSHREALAAELKAKLDATEKTYQQQLAVKETELLRYKAEHEAQQTVYQERLEKELSSIPEKFRELAGVMVKGAGDPRDALTLLHEAKLKNMFEDKTSIVVHNVPGASDGARATDERIAAGKNADRSKMSSQQMIKQGLKGIRSGEQNTMFRNR